MKRNVIVIDDSEFIVEKLVGFFEARMNCKVVATGRDGQAAVDLYRLHRPDLISMDVNMPIKDGVEAVREIKDEFPAANILIISSTHGSRLLECMDFGAKGYIEKPLRLSDPVFVEDFLLTLEEVFG